MKPGIKVLLCCAILCGGAVISGLRPASDASLRLGASRPDRPNDPGRPNIVIIFADDLGYGDLSAYGGDIPSPNIERIGEAGIRFTDFYAAGPVCTVSRYGLLTGRYPQRSVHHLTGALMPEQKGHLDRAEKILPQYLKQNGYRTALFGKWHLGNSEPEYLPCYYGFDKFAGHTHGCIDYFDHLYGSLGPDWYEDCRPLSEKGYSTDLITDHAIRYLSPGSSGSPGKKKPFFVMLSYNAPHYGKSDPYSLPANTLVLGEGVRKGVRYANTLQAPEEYLRRFGHVEDIYRRYYSAMVSCLDDNIGRFLDFLEQSGQAENTIIWFMSDNGGYSETLFRHASNGPLKGQKAQLAEGGIRVPSLVCWKGKIKAGRVVAQPAANLDVLPTLLDIVGMKPSPEPDGLSLLPVLLEGRQIERDIFWKFQDQRAFRRGKWKLADSSLYDLSNDISEQRDLAADKPSVYRALDEAWREISEELAGR